MYEVTIINNTEKKVIHSAHDPPNHEKLPSGLIRRERNMIPSFTFQIYMNNSGYELLVQDVTYVIVTKPNKDIVFEGRVLLATPQMDESGLAYKTVVCEGLKSYLRDSYQPYLEERLWEGDDSRTGLEEFIDYILEEHNSQVETDKKIHRGRVTVDPFVTSDNIVKGLNYEDTYDCIEQKLIASFGGEMDVRRGNDGMLYLDYVPEFGVTKEVPIELGVNILSMSQQRDDSTKYTRLFPLGAKLTKTIVEEDVSIEVESEERLTIASVNNGIRYIDDEEEIKTRGVKPGVILFEEITEPENLLNRTKEYFLSHNHGILSTTAKILNLSLIKEEYEEYELYNTYPAKNKLLGIDTYVRIVGQTINIINPEESDFTFGDRQLLQSDYQINTELENAELKELISQTSAEAKKNQIVTEALYKKVSGDLAAFIVGDFELLMSEFAVFKDTTTKNLSALDAEIIELKSTVITADLLDAKVASLGYVTADDVSATYATIANLNALNAEIDNLATVAITTENLDAHMAEFDYLTAKDADLLYAAIDFANVEKATIGTVLADIGLITSATIVDGHVTGYLDSVSVNANNITAGTLAVERLIIYGSTESIVYALNNSGDLESTSVNTLDGGVITERTVTADHLVAGTITSNELHVAEIFGNEANIRYLTASDVFAEAVSTHALVVSTNELATSAKNTADSAYNIATTANTQANQAIADAETAQKEAEDAATAAVQAQTDADNAAQAATTAQNLANQAQADADAAALAATNAQNTADTAKQNAATAQTKANEAAQKAADAQADAEDAAAQAVEAQKVADQAAADLVTANANLKATQDDLDAAEANLVTVTNRVGVTEEEIAEAQAAVTAAQKAADDAQTDADSAALAASNAQTAADEAASKATTAQNAANAAQTDADNAQATANTATNLANAAQADADAAAIAASKAQSTANTANTNAANAKTAADNAQAAADDAQGTADQAKANAATAQETADSAVAAAQKANTVLANWCYENDTTYIDGANIYAGTVTAVQIAAGTITSNKLNASEIFGNEANVNYLVATDAFISAVETNEILVTASNNASQALSDASDASDAAANAQNTADAAKTAAANAQSTANTAKTNAATAQSAAEAAQSTANTAKANAATAQSTADDAVTAAAAAQTTANEAVDDAAAAQSTANTASTNANSALNRATYHYGTCSTAAATVAKVVTLSGFSLYTGATITVYFTYANTASAPTLNVNGTGAKNIRVNNANITAPYYWQAKNTVTFVYNGSYWVMADTSANNIVANWCYNNDKTYINGGKLYTGTVTADAIAAGAITAAKIAAGAITADKIDVDDLFAQNITATGTITGATLKGATADIEAGTIGGWTVGDYGLYNDDILAGFINAGAFRLYVGQYTYEEIMALSQSGNDNYPYFGVTNEGNVFCQNIYAAEYGEFPSCYVQNKLTAGQIVTVAGADLDELNTNIKSLEWTYLNTVSGTNSVSIPSAAKWVRVEAFIRPTSSSACLSFDFEFNKELNGFSSLFKMQGFYYSSSYNGSVGIYATPTLVRMADGNEWTNVVYGGSSYNPSNMNYCYIRVYYR